MFSIDVKNLACLYDKRDATSNDCTTMLPDTLVRASSGLGEIITCSVALSPTSNINVSASWSDDGFPNDITDSMGSSGALTLTDVAATSPSLAIPIFNGNIRAHVNSRKSK